MSLAPQTMGMGDAASPDPEAVQKALLQILASDEFRASPRLSAFLTFCVGRSVEGKADTLKAYTIATQVFMRPDHFDPQADPIVRVEATRLRRAMQRYYGQEGAGDPLHLHMERGQYGVSFIPVAPSGQTQAMPQLSISLLEKLAAIADGQKGREEPCPPVMFGPALSETDVPEPLTSAQRPDQPEPTLRFSLALLPLDLKLVLLGFAALATLLMVVWSTLPAPIAAPKSDKAQVANPGPNARAFQPARVMVLAETASSEVGGWVEDLRDALSRFDTLVVLDASVLGDRSNVLPDVQLVIRKTTKGLLVLRLVQVDTGEIFWSHDMPTTGLEPRLGQAQHDPSALPAMLTELAAWDGLINRRHWGASHPGPTGYNDETPCQNLAMRALLSEQLALVHGAQACFEKDLAPGLSWNKPQWRLRLDLMALMLGDPGINPASVLAEAQRQIRQSPLSASAYGLAGQALQWLGQGEEAQALRAKARRLNPYDLGFERPQNKRP